MSAKENDMSARFGSCAISPLRAADRRRDLILALPSVQNFLAAASALRWRVGDGRRDRLDDAAVAAALYGLRKRRFGFAAGCSCSIGVALYAAQRNTLATMPRWNRGRCSSPRGPENIVFDDPYWMNFWLKPILSNGKYACSMPSARPRTRRRRREARLISGEACREANNLLRRRIHANDLRTVHRHARRARARADVDYKIGVSEIVKGSRTLD